MVELIIGILLVGSVFIALFAMCASSVGFWMAVKIWAGSIFMTAVIVAGVFLIVGGLNG